ncbi:MAG: thaumatin family protein [Polyangiaceae bacterium]|nr:thaumatin family protein [Polyangiaceae bacterium]MCB9609112.1 thaumatin family protein [Polyangiaceae bacterium]
MSTVAQSAILSPKNPQSNGGFNNTPSWLAALLCVGLLSGCDSGTDSGGDPSGGAGGTAQGGSAGIGGSQAGGSSSFGGEGGTAAGGFGGDGGTGASAGAGSGGTASGGAASGGASTGGAASGGASSGGSGGTSSPDGVRQIRFVNQCSQTIWVGALNAAPEYELPEGGGFELSAGSDHSLVLPEHWGGRFWGRTGCQFDASGNGHCDSGDCGNRMACSGAGGQTPATLAEFTFAGHAGLDFYDISLVDGYNLPLTIRPVAGTFNPRGEGDPYDCGSPGCTSDLNQTCPAELQKKNAQGGVVGCASACEIFQTDEYCCRGAHNTPQTCPPFSYSELFKSACPTAYSYAYDDQTSTYTCFGEDYDIVFCP